MNTPTVGRLVHFYSDAVANRDSRQPNYGHNGQGAGPYPAVITQLFPGQPYANLKVFPPFAPPFDEGSVSEGAEACPGRYWVWPPRNEAVTAPAPRPALTDEQIKHMAERFLGWRLPENFIPDGGISFKAEFNEQTAHPMRHEPTGTNLFDYSQAEAMVRHMAEGVVG